ncbi:MAG: amino acid decarboxylase, partial [Alphaproteobacteria bacterium]
MTKSPLFMSCEEFKRLGRKTLDLAADHMADQERTPVHRDLPEETRQRLMSLPLADQGLAPEEILSFLDDTLLRYPLGNGNRQFFAWINPPPAPIGVLADTLSTCVNATSDGFEHAGTYLQVSTGRWLMELCGFPTEGSLALFLSGGSMANLTALAGARHRAAKTAGWNLREDGLQGSHKRL